MLALWEITDSQCFMKIDISDQSQGELHLPIFAKLLNLFNKQYIVNWCNPTLHDEV